MNSHNFNGNFPGQGSNQPEHFRNQYPNPGAFGASQTFNSGENVYNFFFMNSGQYDLNFAGVTYPGVANQGQPSGTSQYSQQPGGMFSSNGKTNSNSMYSNEHSFAGASQNDLQAAAAARMAAAIFSNEAMHIANPGNAICAPEPSSINSFGFGPQQPGNLFALPQSSAIPNSGQANAFSQQSSFARVTSAPTNSGFGNYRENQNQSFGSQSSLDRLYEETRRRHSNSSQCSCNLSQNGGICRYVN